MKAITDANANFIEVFDVGLTAFSDSLQVPNIVNQIEKNTITVFPNPSNGKFYIKINSNLVYNKIEIYNFSGSKIYNRYLINKNASIDVSNCKSGVYFVKINDKYFKKIIINH